ncbi:MAG: right-handed parallel beta-helix repeat-containing protein [Candidatus Krumholzibacteriota bacterium]|nr:right-handed parallel beta-helix repeat-containing protein [Candidatus Krumholzibacteriota bacterium]
MVIAGNQASSQGGGLYCLDANVTIAHLTVTGNFSDFGGRGISVEGGSLDLQSSLVALNAGNGLFVEEGTAVVSVSCCDVWGNGPDYAGALPDQTGIAGNISEAPLFCDHASGDFTLHVDSPCLPVNNECGILMGACDRGCDDTYFRISGTVLDDTGMPICDAEIQGGLWPVFTNADGVYATHVDPGWSGTLRPVRRGYTFEPPERDYTNVQSDIPHQDFVGFHDAIHHVPADYATIQEAIDVATSGDTILVSAGTYTGEGNRDLDFGGEDIVLIGEGGSEETIIDVDAEWSGLNARAFHFHNEETRAAVVQGFTIRDGFVTGTSGGGGVLIVHSSPSLVDIVFDSCESPYSYSWPGAAIACQYGSPLIQEVTVDDCDATGICIRRGAPELIDVLIYHCDAGECGVGGGIICSDSEATFLRVVLMANSAYEGAAGGGMYITGPAAPTLNDCRFEDNYAFPEHVEGSRGGGLFCTGADPVLENVRFVSNYSWYGGGMYCQNANPTLHHVIFEDNHADQGGALAMTESSPHVENVTFHGNGSDYIWGNPSGGYGAAVYLLTGSSPAFHDCIFGFSTSGPGIHAESGTLPTLACCCIFGNAGGPFGGEMLDWIGVEGNFTHDPFYCGAYDPDEPLSPSAGSPCAPENNDCGVLIGALEVGCDIESYSISGRVTDSEGLPLADVEIVGQTPPIYTDANGDYEVRKMEHWTGRIMAQLPGYVFIPPYREYTDLASDHADQDFVGTRSTLHHVPADHPDLRSALGAAADGDTVLVAPGTYTGDGNRDLDLMGRDLCVIGESGSETTIIDCEGFARGITVCDNPHPGVLIQGFTIRNGFCDASGTAAGGGIRVMEATPTLRDLRFIDCATTSWGGGIHLYHATGAVLENIDARGCSADGHGGGISVWESTVSLETVVTAGNHAGARGAGFYCLNADVTLAHLTAAGNDSGDPGDGVAVVGGSLDLQASLVALNEDTGLFVYYEDTEASVACCDVWGNGDDYTGALPDQTGLNGNIAADPEFCYLAGGDLTVSDASPCLPENNSCGVLIGALGEGCSSPTAAPDGMAPAVVTLNANYPNPFNPDTEIRFGLPEAAPVTLRIYDVAGRLTATLLAEELLPAGWHTAVWRGRDDAGRPQASGIYLSRLEAGGASLTRKMTLLK